MKFFIYTTIILGILAGIGYAVSGPISKAIKEANKPKWRTEEASLGDISSSVDATGKVRPVKSIQVGAFVSGPIVKLDVEHNAEVAEGQLLAEIDPRLYQAAVNRDSANLSSRYAELDRITTLLIQANREEKRAQDLRRDNEGFISQSELDQYVFSVDSLIAQFDIALASIEQAQANLENSNQNLQYTKILAPEAGIVIDRKVEPGQTLAAQFQTPEMFTIAPRMREKIHIYADVDEVDIGKIRETFKQQQTEQAEHQTPDRKEEDPNIGDSASESKNQSPEDTQSEEDSQPDSIEVGGPAPRQKRVKFTVEAYPNKIFEGDIAEVRYSSTETQNVVTYPVIVETENQDLHLLPGMTATLEFLIDKKSDIVRIPNAAIRFLPDVKFVHPDDKDIVEGTATEMLEDDGQEIVQTASQKHEAELKRKKRHVWYLDGELLRAKEIEVGISDNQYTEVLSDNVAAGDVFVTGQQKKAGQ